MSQRTEVRSYKMCEAMPLSSVKNGSYVSESRRLDRFCNNWAILEFNIAQTYFFAWTFLQGASDEAKKLSGALRYDSILVA